MARYIDADELKQERDMAIKAYENANIFTATAIREHIKPLLDKIVDMPTADVVEVKHGEWIDKFNGRFVNPTYICSVCGEKALLECYINELDHWKYRQSLSIRCPHCGAKMNGGNVG